MSFRIVTMTHDLYLNYSGMLLRVCEIVELIIYANEYFIGNPWRFFFFHLVKVSNLEL